MGFGGAVWVLWLDGVVWCGWHCYFGFGLGWDDGGGGESKWEEEKRGVASGWVESLYSDRVGMSGVIYNL